MIPEIPPLLGSQPISPETPQGTSVRYEPEYEELQEEVRKLQSLSGGTVEWSRVAELAVVILGTKSKDLQVASYLCVALLHEQSLKGLAAGLLTCKDLISNYWDTMFPELKRLKGRVSAIEWLSENAAKTLGTQKFTSSDKQQLEQIQETIKQVSDLLQEKIKDRNNLLSELSRKVKEIIEDLGSQSVAEQPKPKPTAQPAASSQAQAPTQISSEADARKALREAQTIVLKAATYLRKADLKNPLPYRLSRSMLWDSIQAPPPNTDGRTQMPAIPAYTMDAQKQLLEKGEPEAIVAQSESTFTSSPFLLDLQLNMDEALSTLGTLYKDVQTVIREELGVLLRRVPQLLDLQFQDGTAFAGPETQEWVRKTVLTSQAAGTGEDLQAGGQSEEARELEETYNKARQLARTKQIKEAISLFQDKLARTPGRRERFLWNFHLAKVLMAGGKQNLALAQLESLDREIDFFSLEEWEPELCQEVLSQLVICQKKVAQETRLNTPELREKLNRLNARLLELNPVSALTIDGKA